MAELRPRPFTRAIREIEVCNKALEVSYLSLNHYLVLLQIFDMEHEEGIQIPKLADMCNLKPTTATRIVQSLGKDGRGKSGGAGLISSVREGRMLTIHLTDEGKALKNRMAAAMEGAGTSRLLSLQDAVLFEADERAESKPKNVTIIPEPIVAKAQVGEVNVEVHSWPSVFHHNQLQRHSKVALSNDPKARHFTWSNHTLELMRFPDCLKRTADAELIREKYRGTWYYWPETKDPKKDMPWGMQPALPTREFRDLVNDEIGNVTNGVTTMTESLNNLTYFLNDNEARRARSLLTKHAANTDTEWLKQKISEKQKIAAEESTKAMEAFTRGQQMPQHMHFEKTQYFLDGKKAQDKASRAASQADDLARAIEALEESKAQQKLMNEKHDALMDIVKRELAKRQDGDNE